jgi:hypothetical protein
MLLMMIGITIKKRKMKTFQEFMKVNESEVSYDSGYKTVVVSRGNIEITIENDQGRVGILATDKVQGENETVTITLQGSDVGAFKAAMQKLLDTF